MGLLKAIKVPLTYTARKAGAALSAFTCRPSTGQPGRTPVMSREGLNGDERSPLVDDESMLVGLVTFQLKKLI
jgi:hypothetical protein